MLLSRSHGLGVVRLVTPAVPFYGMPRRAASDRDAIKCALASVAGSDEFLLGRRVRQLERALAEWLGVEHAVAVSSGTAAVQLAVDALELGEGAEVIVPAFGFHSSLTAVIRSGATPVLVDVTPAGVLDVECTEAAMSARTRAIVPVHVFATTPDMSSLLALARAASARVLENSAVAIGFRHAGRRAATFGDLAVISAHPYKPLGGISDGGFVVSDDAGMAEAVRVLRNHGQDGSSRFLHHRVGYNARMDEISAAVLMTRLRRLHGALERRAQIARRYDAAFADLPELALPAGERERTGIYAYVVGSAEREALERHLALAGVETTVYYPRPLHLQRAFASLGHHEGDFPVAERLCRELLALPLYPEMPEREIELVIRAVRGFHG